jgi:hypothetical protein
MLTFDLIFPFHLKTETTKGNRMWSNDATQNLVLARASIGPAVVRIKPRQDGGFYVSWLDCARGYSLYLQRLDANGNLSCGVGRASSSLNGR